MTVATMSNVGFGLSPASGRAIRDLVMEGACSFASLDMLRIGRLAELADTCRQDLNGLPPTPAAISGRAA